MIKLNLIYLTLWSVAHAAYYSRMATMSRLRSPSAFRPGLTLQRPWNTRLVPSASHRMPSYMMFRNPTQPRYAMRHYSPVMGATRNMFGVWKTTRLPMSPSTPEYEFVRAASGPPVVHADGGSGAIHTIPAPNLSLSEKPIVVMESENLNAFATNPEAPKPTYEVTEKFPDPSIYQVAAKIETPVGFSKATSISSPDVQNFVRNGAALQLASEFGLSAVQMPQNHILHPMPFQSFNAQAFNGLPTQHDLNHAGAEGIIIPPNSLLQSDPHFMQKLQNQLMNRYPSVEFIPYSAEIQNVQPRPQIQAQIQPHTPMLPQLQAQPSQNQLFLLENEQIKQQPSAFVAAEAQRTVVQRETPESVVTIVPKGFSMLSNNNNVTENIIEVSSPQAQNLTLELIATESQPSTTTVKYIIDNSANNIEVPEKTTPVYIPPVGETIGDIVAKGFFAAVNDVRAAVAAAQVEKPQEIPQEQANITSTTLKPDLKDFFQQTPGTENQNVTVTELKPVLGAPFSKNNDAVNVAYTLVRNNNPEGKVPQDGSVLTGQIVEASISEDQEFNKEKATLLSRRAPLRLVSVPEIKEVTVPAVTNAPPSPKINVIKAKIPPKSKLTFDDKGEPVLRIYASYVDNPIQKEVLTTKLTALKQLKEVATRKDDSIDNWKTATIQAVNKAQGFDANQVTSFGVKLRSRSDDYLPLFEDYEE